MQNCVLIIIYNGCGQILLGQRRDSNKWTTIAGHIESGETPDQAAIRELEEESGLKIDAKDLNFLSVTKTKEGSDLFCYSILTNKPVTPENDPDQEFKKLRWIDVRKGIPSNIFNNLEYPGPENVLKRVFNLEKSEKVWTSTGIYDEAEPMAKSEVLSLLRHPDPQERAMALKLDSVTPDDLSIAILDVDPMVFKTAFYHPLASRALTVLASNTRDLLGNLILGRRELLLSDSRATPKHINLLLDSAYKDKDLTVNLENDHIYNIEKHPFYIAMAEVDDWNLENFSQKESPAVFELEEPANSVKDLYYTFHRNNKEPVWFPELPDFGSCTKVIYKVDGIDCPVMVKGWFDSEHSFVGWAELTSLALYEAASIGDLHQKVWPVKIDDLVGIGVLLEPNVSPIRRYIKNIDSTIQTEQAKKIAIMDFISYNYDRHSYNLLCREDQNKSLLAIDHSFSFDYPSNGVDYGFNLVYTFLSYIKNESSLSNYFDFNNDWSQAINWFMDVKPLLKRKIRDRLEKIKDPILAQKIANTFDSNLDKVSMT